MEAALKLFAAEGFEHTTVPDIVAEAGVGHGTFYEYFSNRRDVLVAIAKEARARWPGPPELASPLLSERIRYEILWYIASSAEDVALRKVWHEAGIHDPDIAAARRSDRAMSIERIRRGVVAGGRPGVDAGIAAAALLALLEEFTHRWFVEGDGPGREMRHIVAAAETIYLLWIGATGLDETATV